MSGQHGNSRNEIEAAFPGFLVGSEEIRHSGKPDSEESGTAACAFGEPSPREHNSFMDSHGESNKKA